MFTTIQEGIQAIQKQILSDTPPEHALYIPAQGKRTTYATEDAFDLYPAVNEFLKYSALNIVDQKNSKDQKTPAVDNGRKVLLLLGDTGSGKSLFCQDLIARLWQSYKSGNPIPLFISLARLQDPIDNAIEETLTSYGFSAEQVATLKKEQQFIFVLDGYDEIHQFKNLYVTNKLNEWNARTIITCRSQYLYYLSDTDKHFMPFHGEKRQPHLLQQFYVAPFSEKEIVAYVQQYEKLNGQAVVADLKDHKSDMKSAEAPKPVLYQQLVSIPGLQTLITTPFLLHLAVEVLPDILVKYKASHPNPLPSTGEGAFKEQQKLTQSALYDVFIERWFKRQELKLKTSKHIDEKAADPKLNFWKFCKELAATMRAQNVTLINYTPEKVSKFASATAQNKLNPWKQFFSEDQETELLRSACPIRKLGPNQYGFIHASLIEYFATRAMYEEVVAQQPQQIVISTAAVGDAKDSKQANLLPLPQNTLYQSSITKQNNMIRFLADRVQESEVFKNKLFEAIESSKKDERYAVGAANAITALNCAEVNFNGLDFNGIRIPRANLSGALCDNTSFQDADLTEVNFQSAWLREANLCGATMANIDLGEWPSIKIKNGASVCSYSPDGRWLAINGEHTVTLFTAITRQLVRIFKGHTDYVLSIAFDAKSERLATGSSDKTVRVWEVLTGKELRCLSGHKEDVNSVAWDSKGERLVSGSNDKTVRVWEVLTGNELRCLNGHTANVDSVAWDGKGEYLASGSSDETVRVWEVSTGKELSLLGHMEGVNSVAWDSKGERLASGGDDNSVRIWDISTGKELRCLSGHTGEVNAVAWDSKSERLASGGDDKTVRVWDVSTGKELRCLSGHTGDVRTVAWDSKSERLASGSHDGTVRVWNMLSNKELHCLDSGHKNEVNKIAFDMGGRRLLSASDDAVRVWEVTRGKELRCIGGQYTKVDFDTKNERLLSLNGSSLHLHDMVNDKELYRLGGHTDSVNSVAWDTKGELFVSGSSDKTLQLWDVTSGKQLRCFSGHRDKVNCVAFDSSGLRLASGSDDDTVRVWEVASGKELHCFSDFGLSNFEDSAWVVEAVGKMNELRNTLYLNGIRSIAWDSKSDRLVSGGNDHAVLVWEVSSGKKLYSLLGHAGFVTSVAWDSKGEHLASGSGDKTIRIWDAASGKVSRVLQGHTNVVMSVAFDAKGERIVSGGHDKTVRLWDVATGSELQVYKGHTGVVMSVVWDFKNERLASGSYDKTVRIWDISSDKELHCLHGNNVINSVAFDPKDNRLVSGDLFSGLQLWEIVSGKKLHHYSGARYQCAVFDAKGEQLAAGRDDGIVQIWKVINGKELHYLFGHTGSVDSIAFNAAGCILASLTSSGVQLWDVASGKELRRFKGMWLSIIFDSKGERLASGSSVVDKIVRVWEIASGKELHCLRGHTSWIKSIAFDAKGERLMSGGGDRTVRMWGLQGVGGKELYQLPLPQAVNSFSWMNIASDKELLAVAFGNSVACFMLVQVKNNYQAALSWLATPTTILHTPGMNLMDVKGINATNYDLLKQQGAVREPVSVDEDGDSSELASLLKTPRIHTNAIGSRNSFFKPIQSGDIKSDSAIKNPQITSDDSKAIAAIFARFDAKSDAPKNSSEVDNSTVNKTKIKQNSAAEHTKNVVTPPATTVPLAGSQPSVSKSNCCVM